MFYVSYSLNNNYGNRGLQKLNIGYNCSSDEDVIENAKYPVIFCKHVSGGDKLVSWLSKMGTLDQVLTPLLSNIQDEMQ